MTQPFADGFLVGHASGTSTGVTVVLCPEGAVIGADVCGGATGTRAMDSCHPGHLVERVHGLCLAGGSAYGLAAAGGVMRWLEERGHGFPTAAGVVPIVPSAILYDLALGDAGERPDEAMGYAACEAASSRPPASGSIGAGRGATVGKLFGKGQAMKGGFGVASRQVEELSVTALAAVNAFGDIIDARGQIVAGARGLEGGFIDMAAAMAAGTVPGGFTVPAGKEPGLEVPPPATTLVALLTNAAVDRQTAGRMAAAGSTGVTRAIRPVHTRFDGDVVFALATGEVQASPDQLGALAATLTAEAILDAVRSAASLDGVPAVAELA